MTEKLIALDTSFNLDEAYAYKKNHCSLITFDIVPVDVEKLFFVNNIPKKIFFPKKHFQVQYRQWRNKQWTPLEGEREGDHYWTSFDKANTWKDKMIAFHKIQPLSKEDAFIVAEQIMTL